MVVHEMVYDGFTIHCLVLPFTPDSLVFISFGSIVIGAHFGGRYALDLVKVGSGVFEFNLDLYLRKV